METIKKIIALLLSPFTFLASVVSTYAYLWFEPKWSEISQPDAAPPPAAEAFASLEAARAAGGGWYVTMDEDFAGDALPAPWVPSPHGLRNKEYWCDNMLDAGEDGKIKILAAKLDENACGVCPAAAEFASGIETRQFVGGVSVPTFEQAFGYYECRVKVPANTGMWSAFWLQSNSQGRVGARGKDGTEIDIYESAFLFTNPQVAGNALLWDGYGGRFSRVADSMADTGVNLYEGWHTYSLLWTPERYTFFVDGKATWQTNAGGVSRVPAFLRLTTEIRRGETGPYGVALGEFTNTKENPAVFEIDYVKVYQHTDFLGAVRAAGDFRALKVPGFMQ